MKKETKRLLKAVGIGAITAVAIFTFDFVKIYREYKGELK